MYKFTDDDLKPKNRTPNSLPLGSKMLEHAGGSIMNKWPAWLSVLITNQKLITEMKPVPGAVSIVSGQPAIIYRSGGAGIEMALTPEEALRHIGNSLDPEEYFAIMMAFGDHEEISEQHYHRHDGDARNPALSRIAYVKAGLC